METLQKARMFKPKPVLRLLKAVPVTHFGLS